MEIIDRNDPLESAEKASGKFKDGADGNTQYIPSKDELERLNLHFSEEVAGAENDSTPYFNEIAENYQAYYGSSIDARWSDSPVLQLPIVNRCIEQMVSWYVLQVMRQTPVVSFKPYHNESYTVPVMAEGLGAAAEKTMSGEQLAASYERGFDKILREKCGFRKWLSGVMKEAHIAGRSYTKTYYAKDERTVSVPKTETKSGIISALYAEPFKAELGESARFERVPITSILTPIDQQDPQKSDWIAEKVVMSNTELRNSFAAGEFPLVKPKEFEEILRLSTAYYRTDAEKRISKQDDKSTTLITKRHVLYMIWFERPVKVDGKLLTYSFCGLFHRDAKRFLCIYKNPYMHKERPFSLFIEGDEEDNEFGISAVGKIKGHAALLSMMLHIDIQNAVQSVNVNWFADPTSPGFQTLVNEEDYPGRVIPRRTPGEIEPVPLGRQHAGLSNQYAVVLDDLMKTINLSIYEEGMHVPGRTAAASIKQIMDAGYQKPMKNMLALSDFIAKMLRQWLEIKRQYEPYGETFRHVDEGTKEVMEAVIRYPVGRPLDMFRIGLTAADEFMAKDEDMENRVMIYNLVTQNNQTLSQMIGGLVTPGAPTSIVNAIADMAEGQNNALKYVIEGVRKDTDSFLMNDEMLPAILEERMMAMQMMNVQGGMSGPGQGEEAGSPAVAGEQPMGGSGGPPQGNPGQVPPTQGF